jgi:predicted metal-dependent phosphoesterase TrpH
VRCDLHLHSTHSDGGLSPRQLVAAARAAHLHRIALTDHDTMAGVAEAQQEAARLTDGLRVLAGCEVTSSLEGRDVHLLAYFRAPPGTTFLRFLERVQRARRVRLSAGLQALGRRTGRPLDLGQVEARFPGAVPTRTHVARTMVATGMVPDTGAAFRDHLAFHHGLFPPLEVSPELALASIHEADGLGFLAHPDEETLAAGLTRLRRAGLDGLEVVTRRGRVLGAEEAVERYDLMACGGSDWHPYGPGAWHDGWHVEGSEVAALLEWAFS